MDLFVALLIREMMLIPNVRYNDKVLFASMDGIIPQLQLAYANYHCSKGA
jgi:hypothetical protein